MCNLMNTHTHTHTQLPPLFYPWSTIWISSHSTPSSFHLQVQPLSPVVHAFGDAISGEPLPELTPIRPYTIYSIQPWLHRSRGYYFSMVVLLSVGYASTLRNGVFELKLSLQTLAPRLPSISCASAVRVVQNLAFMLLHVFQITHHVQGTGLRGRGYVQTQQNSRFSAHLCSLCFSESS